MTDSTHDSQGADDSSEMELVLEIACNVADTLEQAVQLGEEDLLRVALLTLERIQVDESVEVSLLVTDDEGLRELNRDFRGRDEATDVLSFPLLDTPLVEAAADELWQPGENGPDGVTDDAPGRDDHGAAGLTDTPDEDDIEDGDDDQDDEEYEDDEEDAPLHLGDIAISRDAVVRQAAAAGHSIAWECAYLFAHGLLHLVGYDDSTDAGYHAMVAHQEAVLAEAHIAK
ncbi:MAG TPA: rRNA maturation RNase YbeY [Ktedonobacterales bacterium]|nr:rRNA maturation RNase YbeY [Ktedonobacterales bacterium]